MMKSMRSVSFCENLDTIKTFFVFNGRKPEEIVVRFSIDFLNFLISDYTKKEFQMLMTLISMISYVKKNEGRYSINFSQFKRDGGFERLSKKEMEKVPRRHHHLNFQFR